MAKRRPPNKSGIFLGGVGGTTGPRGEGVGLGDLSKRIAAERAKQTALAARKTQKKPSGFFENLADDIGLDDFYERDVIPVIGRTFSEVFGNVKETYGLGTSSPLVLAGRTAARAVGKGEEFDEGFDYAADAVRAAAGIVKTKGWEPAKKYVAPAIDKGTKIAGEGIEAFADTVKKADDEIESAVPQYAIVKNWADRHAVEPAKDFAAEAISKVAGQPVNMRIAAADDLDRNFIYMSNDITQRGRERESAATPQQRERWIRMATGGYENPAWEGYESPFSVEQLQQMSDYELVNAAYGTHTNSLAGLFEAAKNDFKKIAAMPAALNILSDQIMDADKRGDYRGLGNMAEFLARQAASVVLAVNNATLYAATGGQMGDYKPLVRALKTEPILTSLDAAATASLYGKGATVALKTGGAVSKAGAVASRIPGAPRVGGAIARGASAAAYGERLGAPLRPGFQGPSGVVAAPALGAPLRAAAAAARGARRIADVERVEVRDPALRPLSGIAGVELGADRVFRPSSSFFSKSASLLRKRLYEGENPISRAIYRRGEKADARAARAINSAIVEQLGSERAAPIVAAFTEIYKESPDLAMRVLWDTQGPSSFVLPAGMGGKVVDLSPGAYADELEDVLAGRLWLRRGSDPEADGNDVFRFSDESPGDGWERVSPYGSVRTPGEPITKLTKSETSIIQAQIDVLRRLDDLPEDVVVRAREVLQKPYNEVFGERIGRRIGGRAAPTGSLENLLSTDELEDIRAITGLGVNVDPRIADLPSGVADRLRGQLGIGAPTGITRRAEGMAATARLQDLTIARLMPLVPDEVRADVERILAKAIAEKATEYDLIKDSIVNMRRDIERGVKAEEMIPFMQEALRQLEDYANNKIDGLPPVTEEKRLEILAATRAAWEAIEARAGTVDEPSGVQGIASIPDFSFQSLAVPPDIVFGEKIGDATGSNVSGVTGLWRGTDGVERYVKEYDDPTQVASELAANELYRQLGILVPGSRLSVSPDGKAVIANDIVKGVRLTDFMVSSPEEVQAVARQILKGIVADAWLANWDTVGLNLDNIIVTDDLRVYRIDQGGALFHRAQGELKGGPALAKADLDDFWNNNPSYKKIIQLAGYESVDEIPSVAKQLEQIQKLAIYHGGTIPLADRIASDLRKSVEGDALTNVSNQIVDYLNNNNLGTVLGRRFNSLKNKIKTTPVSSDPIAALVQRGPKAIREYQGSGHRPINEFLRGMGGENYGDLDTYNGLFPADGDVVDQIMQYVAVMDRLFDEMPATTEDLVVYRGMRDLEPEFIERFLEEDYVFIDDGFVSTSFRDQAAESFTGDPKTSMMLEILVPEGSKGFYGDGVYAGSYGAEREFILPRGTAFKVVDSIERDNGTLVVKAIALTPDNPQISERFPEFGQMLDEIRALKAENLRDDLEEAESTVAFAKKAQEELPRQQRFLEEAEADYKKLLEAQKNVDFVLESLMRDALEASDTPTGAMVFMPTLGGGKNAKKTVFPKSALADRGRPRDLKDIYTGQFAMLGSLEDLEQFSGALARNMRVPFVAYEIVTRLTDYLMRTGTTVRFSNDKATFEKQIEELSEAGLINGNGELGTDYVILPVNNKTGFFDEKSFESVKTKELEEVGTKGRSDVGVDDAQLSVLIQKTLAQNALDNLQSIPRGSTVVILSKGRLDALQKELAAAAQAPGRLRQLTRLWVRITLTTLPRTPIANVVGSAFLSMLGNGLGGYPAALRMLRFSNAPPELLNKGLAGMFDEGGDLVVPSQGKRFRFAQRYMNYMYYYNVMGEDLARLSVFAQQAKKGIKKSGLAKQIDDELLEATELNDAFQELLEAVARGEFANGKPLTPELIRIRDDALQKADDFLGGARGLTSQQRMITTFIPFWQWYKHIFKLYFYTLPFKYPGRSLTLNAMARYGAEESARQGYYDSFYEDGIKIGEEVRGPNIYSKALSTNIFPFTFAGLLEAEEGAPGASFLASNVAPVITTPLRIAGFGIPGQPLITAEGQRPRGEFISGEMGEIALSEAERLIAPVGLLQRYLTPRGSLLLGAGRLATGRDIPQAEQQGEGAKYAVTPRGFGGLGLQAAPELLARAFGGTIERVPVQGPAARRRLKEREERERQRVLERYKEERRERMGNG